MNPAPDLAPLSPGLFIWQGYDAAVRSELFSSALRLRSGIFLVDPIPLADSALRDLEQFGPVGGIIVTNSNHHRASLELAQRFAIPIFAHAAAFPDQKPAAYQEISEGSEIDGGLQVISIDGAPAGEVALYYPGDRGTLIVGDALINFDPYGFALLPPKYCTDAKEMKRSLGKLLAYQADRILFAHGNPIITGASARLRRLLDVDLAGSE